jgi:hypothetical protein
MDIHDIAERCPLHTRYPSPHARLWDAEALCQIEWPRVQRLRPFVRHARPIPAARGGVVQHALFSWREAGHPFTRFLRATQPVLVA